MLNKNCIKTILNVKYTCIDKVTMLADTSIMISQCNTSLKLKSQQLVLSEQNCTVKLFQLPAY